MAPIRRKYETCFVYLDFSTMDKEASQEEHKNNMGLKKNWITRRNERELRNEDPTDFSFDLRHFGKHGCSHDSHDNSSLLEVRASPDKLSWFT